MKLVNASTSALLGPGDQRDRRQAARIRKEPGRRVYVVGSSKHNNEQAMLAPQVGFAVGLETTATTRRAFCHSTTVAGVARPGATAR